MTDLQQRQHATILKQLNEGPKDKRWYWQRMLAKLLAQVREAQCQSSS